MKPIIISEATSRGVIIYGDGQPVLVAVKLGQVAKLGEDAFKCHVALQVEGERYDLTDHRLCMKLAGECARVAFALAG